MQIPFNKPAVGKKELEYIHQALQSGKLSGDGSFTQRCHSWLETHLQARKTLLTHSCTAALEMAALLIDLKPGDEVIMPSFTFVSTANAVLLRGAIPVFVDVRPDTCNMDESLIEVAITPKTKAIIPVHYAGVACEMDTILAIARKHSLTVIEDAAQGLGSTYKGKALGTLGHFGALSFHDTKNIVAGEGGAVIVNAPEFIERAEIIREKGTNRKKFLRGEVDKYTWVDIGSSFLPSDLLAAVLLAQLEACDAINEERRRIWTRYHLGFRELEAQQKLVRPAVPDLCEHNGHIYYIVLPSLKAREDLIAHLKSRGISSVFHYVPLHSSPAGLKYGRAATGMAQTDRLGECLLRLPSWVGLTPEMQDRIVDEVIQQLSGRHHD